MPVSPPADAHESNTYLCEKQNVLEKNSSDLATLGGQVNTSCKFENRPNFLICNKAVSDFKSYIVTRHHARHVSSEVELSLQCKYTNMS